MTDSAVKPKHALGGSTSADGPHELEVHLLMPAEVRGYGSTGQGEEAGEAEAEADVMTGTQLDAIIAGGDAQELAQAAMCT